MRHRSSSRPHPSPRSNPRAIAAQFESAYSVELLRDIVHDVVQAVKRNLHVDWTEPHREDVKAGMRAAVKRVLRTRGVKSEDLEAPAGRVMEQAEAIYGELAERGLRAIATRTPARPVG